MFLGACRRRRRRGGLKLYQLRAAWGATGQLSGIWLGLWVSTSGGVINASSPFLLPRAPQLHRGSVAEVLGRGAEDNPLYAGRAARAKATSFRPGGVG